MKWVLAVVAAVVLTAAGLWLTGLLKLPVPPPHLRLPAAAADPVLVSLPQVTSNLESTSGTHFVEVTMTVKLRGKIDAKALSSHDAAVQDAVLETLRAQTAADLNGSSGMQALQGQLATAVDSAIGVSGAVLAVYFTQFLVD